MKKYVPFGALLIALIIALVTPTTEVTTMTVGTIDTGDTAWLLMSAALVLLMTPGLAFFYGGMVAKKNVISTMLQSFVCLGLITVLWVVFGFSLAFGDDIGGIIGDPTTFFMMKGMLGNNVWPAMPTVPIALFAMFQLKFAVITPALITGADRKSTRLNSSHVRISYAVFCL